MSAIAPAPAAPLAHVRRVRVGSTNGPKIEAVRAALAPWAPAARVEGVPVPSGVPEQPVGFAEIVDGARARAIAARAGADCDLGVGIEDGLVTLPGVDAGPLNVGCAAVTDGRRVSIGLSSGFAYPPACSARAIARREPIGDLFDRTWAEARGETPSEASALSVGNVGKLTLGVLPRAEYARHAVVCALVRFLHPDLYPDEAAAP